LLTVIALGTRDASADTVTLTFGVIPPGQSSTVTVRAVIGGTPCVLSNQAVVSGTGLTPTPSDDPTVLGGGADPTIIGVDPINPPCAVLPKIVFVAPTGDDQNDCGNESTPCRNLAAAIAQVAAGGQVVVVSTGHYDNLPIVITKGVTISSPPGIAVIVSQPITVNAPGARVALRGLTIEGAGVGNGVTLIAAGVLSIEDTTLGRWATGVRIINAAASYVSIANSVFRANTSGLSDGGGHPGSRISVEDSRFEGNAQGIEVLSAAFTIRDSAFVRNTGHGAVAGPGSAMIHRSEFSQNQTAVATLIGGSVTLSRSSVFGNALGLSAAGGGIFQSMGSSAVRRNTVNTSGTITLIPEQ
jgi:hypothetical protein